MSGTSDPWVLTLIMWIASWRWEEFLPSSEE